MSPLVMELLRELHLEGATICMVTHDPRFARYAQRIPTEPPVVRGRRFTEEVQPPLQPVRIGTSLRTGFHRGPVLLIWQTENFARTEPHWRRLSGLKG